METINGKTINFLLELKLPNGESFLESRLGNFIIATDSKLDSLVTLIHNNSYKEAKDLAHKIRTSCGVFGATGVLKQLDLFENSEDPGLSIIAQQIQNEWIVAKQLYIKHISEFK
jgi:HPt (histidine-containing phosphotransfer) domain-containing protein